MSIETAVIIDGELRGVMLDDAELLALTADQLRQAVKAYGLVVIRYRHMGRDLFDMIDPGVICHEEFELVDIPF